MRRRLLSLLVVIAAAAAVYAFVLRDTEVEPRLTMPQATATIGSGSSAVAVDRAGRVQPWLVIPDGVQLPSLPISEPPPGGRLKGPVLKQAKVLGAAPAALRPYIESSYDGESGTVVVLRVGIELLFGDASQVDKKWRAAAAVLSDPDLTAADYVDLSAPKRPAWAGSGHALPALE